MLDFCKHCKPNCGSCFDREDNRGHDVDDGVRQGDIKLMVVVM